MGTKYVRNNSLPSSVKINQGESLIISVPHIYSALSIGTILKINLRQNSQLSFVTISEHISLTLLHIDTKRVVSGDYDLVLESFNTLSTAKSTLKTDMIKV